MSSLPVAQPPQLTYAAELLAGVELLPDPDAWAITFPLAGPARRLYTDVVIAADVPAWILDDLLRQVAVDCYGTAWSFYYPPEYREVAVARYRLRRRERIRVTAVDVRT